MSAKEYYMTPEMMGVKSVRCFMCNSLMIRHFLSNTFEIGLECRVCKCKIYMSCKESIPVTQNLERKEYDKEFDELKEKVSLMEVAHNQQLGRKI